MTEEPQFPTFHQMFWRWRVMHPIRAWRHIRLLRSYGSPPQEVEST